MRPILVIFLVMFFTGHVKADCAGSGLWTYPRSGSIKQNSLVVLEGYARSQRIIRSLNEKYPVYLESVGHCVPLTLKGTFRGMFNVTQAILEPDEILMLGKTYQLKIDNLDDRERSLLMKRSNRLGDRAPIAWKVEGETDFKAPNLLGLPEIVDKRVELYGCGPAVYAEFKLRVEDESAFLIKTELISLESGKSNTYYLLLNQSDNVNVGHGMCSGAFRYKKSGKYKVRFSLMDICGNENDKWTEWVKFSTPFEEP